MHLTISNSIRIKNATDEIRNYCENNFWVSNPEYYSKQKLGLWTGATPERLMLYSTDCDDVILPIGLFAYIKPLLPADVKQNACIDLANVPVDFNAADFGLYDYQETAVAEMLKAGYGILHSKAGSGKTQMGLALAAAIGQKCLWLTHTNDLLTQSYCRAERYISKNKLGKIAAGKVAINDITFATVQTMSRLDLTEYRYTFGTVIVDECHRICGSPSHMGQFAKVINKLAARHKYGLSATVHRADNMERSIFAYIGDVKYSVHDDAVSDKVMPASVQRFDTGICADDLEDYTDYDGTIIWSKYVTALANCYKRNQILSQKIIKLAKQERTVLVLSDRIIQLEHLCAEIICAEFDSCIMLTGKDKPDDRKRIINMVKTGGIKILLSTYALAKEGLDIPRLDTLVMATPVKDYAVVVQACGRIMRNHEHKQQPLVIDVVDDDRKSEQLHKQRCRIYRKENIKICG